MRQLEDRVAVVTGAASGIGRALAVRLAERGCRLALVDVDADGLETLARSLAARGTRTSVHVCDLRDRDRLARLPDEVTAEHRAVHLLVNNAGVALQGTLAEDRVDDLDWIVDVNFWGVVLGCKFFLPVLLRQEAAHIVNVSSLFGLIGLPSVGAYCATKAAVRSYSQTLAAELRGHGVTVTCVHPGGVRTEIVRRARMSDESARADQVESFERFGITPERAARRIVRAIERDRTRVRIGWETHVADWLTRLAPAAVSRGVAWGWARREAQGRTGPEP